MYVSKSKFPLWVSWMKIQNHFVTQAQDSIYLYEAMDSKFPSKCNRGNKFP